MMQQRPTSTTNWSMSHDSPAIAQTRRQPDARSPRHQKRYPVLILLLTLLAFALRIYRLDHQSLWYDEGFSVWLASKDLITITTGDFNPPLYIYLLHFWIRFAGSSEFAVRFLSLFFSMLVIPLSFRTAADLFDRPTGLVAAFFLTIAPLHLWYAQETRMYAQATALVLLATLALLYALKGRRIAWTVYILATIGAIYTHYYAWMIVGAHGVFALWCILRQLWHKRFRPARIRVNQEQPAFPYAHAPVQRWVVSQIVLVIAILPWIPNLIQHYRHQTLSYWPGTLSFEWITHRTFLAFSAGETLKGPLAQWSMIGFLALAAIGVVGSLIRSRHAFNGVVFTVLLIGIPLVGTYLLVHDRPKFVPRYLIVASPAFYVLAAAGLRALWPRRSDALPVRVMAGALACAVFTFLTATSAQSAANMYYDPAYARDDFRGLAQFLEQNVGEDEGILLLSGHFFPVFEYYYQSDNWIPIPQNTKPSPSITDVVTLDVAEELDRFAINRRGFWVVLWQEEVADPNGVLMAILDRTGEQVPVPAQFHGLKLRHYRFPPTALFTSEIQHPLGLNPVPEVRLAGYDILQEPAPADRPIDVLLYWQALQPMQHNYKISLRLHDDKGLLWAKSDGQLAGFWYPTYRWAIGEVVLGRHPINLPAGIPPGTYNLDAILYDAENELSPLDLHLGRITIGRPITPPTVEDLGIPHPLTAFFGSLELLGYDIQTQETVPGGTIEITLFWRAHQGPGIQRLPEIHLGGFVIPLSSSFPFDRWQAGDVFRTRHRIQVPAENPGGVQPLQITVRDAAGNTLAPPTRLTDVTVAVADRRFVVPTNITYPERVELGKDVIFLGYDLPQEVVKPGEKLHLTLYWQARAPMDKSYKVFTHLLSTSIGMWGQLDDFPLHGTRPTTGWLPGEVIIDPYEIPVDPAAPAGEYVIEVGMYDPQTLERLPAIAGGQRLPDDRILLKTIRVEP